MMHGGGCTKAATVTPCSKLRALGNVSTGDAAAGPESLCPGPAVCWAPLRRGRDLWYQRRSLVEKWGRLRWASASTLHVPSDAHPFRLLEASLFLRKSCPPVRHSRAAGSPVSPSRTASEASSARQTRPLAPRRQCSVASLFFSTHPRATNAPPSPRLFHRRGGVGATAPDVRHLTVRVGRPSGPSAQLPTRTQAAGGCPPPPLQPSPPRAPCPPPVV